MLRVLQKYGLETAVKTRLVGSFNWLKAAAQLLGDVGLRLVI